MSKDAHCMCFVTNQEQLVWNNEFASYRLCTSNLGFQIKPEDETLIKEATSKTSHNRLTSLQNCVQAQVKDASALLSATCIQYASQTRCLDTQKDVSLYKIEV